MIGHSGTGAVAATLALLGCFLLGATSAAAAPGDLDPSFSRDGRVAGCEDFTLREPGFSEVVIQGDGKIVAAGDCGLVRLNPDGTTDDSFVTDSDPYSRSLSLAAVALQPDGRLVVAGHEYDYLNTPGSDFVVARYNPDGSRDDTFSGDGLVTLDFAGHYDEAKAIAVQPDGKIVVAGYSVELDADDVPSRDFALARYDPDGTLDDTFSGDGKRTTNFADDTAHDIALQPDGRIVVGGSASGDFALVRYDQDGHLDPTFSGDGRATVGFTDAQGVGGRAIAVQPGGRIVAAGGTSGDFALARFGPNGSLDTTFGGDGVVTTEFGATDRRGVTAASDVVFEAGRLLAAGYANGDFALARYELDGDLDPGYSGDGMVTTDMGHEYARASSIAVQPDGRIVVGGSAYSYILDYTASYGVLARYLSGGPADADADGVLDSDDLCPQAFAPQHGDGCHRVRRTISLELTRYRRHRYFSGLLSSACASDTRVRVFKIKRGGRRVRVASGTPDYNPDEIQWSYSIPTNRTRGRYFAKLRRELTPGGWCSRAKSPVLRLRRR